MKKSIYEKILGYLTWLMSDEFGNNPYRPKLTVSERLDIFNIVKEILEKAQKQEKLLNQIKDIINRPYDISSMLEELKRYVEIENLIKELENE